MAKEPRSLERFQELSSYLKQRRARERRRLEIDAAWQAFRGRRRKVDLSATLDKRAQLCRKHHDQAGLCFYCGQSAWLPPPRRGSQDSIPEGFFEDLRANRRRQQSRATREHLVKVADGGGDDDGNIVMACANCNHHRHDVPVNEYRRRRLRAAEDMVNG